ncbi:MAG: alpha/beta hydrolase [Anaerolineaceae bacterium]|nr:alpha/beta hydrolase [Anaerolineaceae bacterium]
MTYETSSPLHYEIAGEGDVVVLGHAGFVDSRMWDDQWQALTERYRVIRYDMQGYGQSGSVTAPISRRNELITLLRSLNVTQAHFIGSSLSGAIYIDVALAYPDLVSSLIIASAAPNGFQMVGQPPRYMMEMFEAWQKGDLSQVTELQTRIWIDGGSREPDQIDQKLRKRVAEMNVIAVQNRTMLISDSQPADPLDPPAVSRLDKIHCPTLIIDGELDHPEIHRAATLMAEQISNARRQTISGAAHMPNLEKPSEFNRLVLDFLQSVK